MSFTVHDFERSLSLPRVGERYPSLRDFYQHLWQYGRNASAYGAAEVIETSTGYDDGREERTMIFSVGGRHFRKMGFYDSWGEEDDWDGAISEVQAVEVTAIKWEDVS